MEAAGTEGAVGGVTEAVSGVVVVVTEAVSEVVVVGVTEAVSEVVVVGVTEGASGVVVGVGVVTEVISEDAVEEEAVSEALGNKAGTYFLPRPRCQRFSHGL